MGSIVALDSMIFIYLFETDSRFIGIVDNIFSQIESGQTPGITSIISFTETLSSSRLTNKPQLTSEITRFFYEAKNLTVYPVDFTVAEKAASLRRRYPHLHTPNALQLATAQVYSAANFITYDKKLLGLKIPGLKIQPLGLDR